MSTNPHDAVNLSRTPLKRARFVRLFLALLAGLGTTYPAGARTYIVWEGTDSTRITSLRGAILDANRRGGNHLIILSGSTYQLTLGGVGDDAGQTGDLDVRCNLLVQSARPGKMCTINATGLGDRAFDVLPKGRLTLSRLNITGAGAAGYDVFSPLEGEGGAIRNLGHLVLNRCRLVGNASGEGHVPLGNTGPDAGGPGGGIFNSGTMTLNRCVINENSGGSGNFGGSGGGIFNTGTAKLMRCTIARNSGGAGAMYVTVGTAGGDGGGVCNLGQMILMRCTVAKNTSGDGGPGGFPGWANWNSSGDAGGPSGNGAGIFNAGTMKLTLCTVSGNTNGVGGNGHPGASGGAGGKGGDGGGIYNAGGLTLVSCTVSYNAGGAGGIGADSRMAPGADGGAGGSGGGIFAASNSIISLQNTLVALNSVGTGGTGGAPGISIIISFPPPPPFPAGLSGSNGTGLDLTGIFVSAGFNLIGAADQPCGITNGIGNDLAGSLASPIVPLLGALAMNGGVVATHALLPGSPAIDQGNGFGLLRDQRGSSRVDFEGIPNPPAGDGADIGAFEFGGD